MKRLLFERRWLPRLSWVGKIVVPFTLMTYVSITPSPAYAMHIMEGFLPPKWALFWYIVSIPFLIAGIRKTKQIVSEKSSSTVLLAMAGAFVFILSALKLPSIAGSSSHPTGVALGAILFGPSVMTVIGFIVLIFQALLIAHGGISTLGANACSMAIAGPIVSYLVYQGLKRMRAPLWSSVFFAASIGDLVTYMVTSLQLALAFPDSSGGFSASLAKFMTLFALTQVPLAIVEGILTVIIIRTIYSSPGMHGARENYVIEEENAR